MTTPTQAQIEAAARAICIEQGAFDPDESTDNRKDWKIYEKAAAAALTAAAEAEEHTYTQSQLDNAVKQTWSATIERCIQAAKNVRPCGTPKLMRESIIAAIRAMKDQP